MITAAEHMQQVYGQVCIVKGEELITGEAREPGTDEAAALVRELADAGTVARLDLVHAALREAYSRGRAAERAEVAQLAEAHVATFQAALAQRGRDQAAHAALPWHLQ